MSSDGFDFNKGRAAPLELEDDASGAAPLDLASVPPPARSGSPPASAIDSMPMRSVLEDDGAAPLPIDAFETDAGPARKAAPAAAKMAASLAAAPASSPGASPPSTKAARGPTSRDAPFALPDLEADKERQEEALEAARIASFGDAPTQLVPSVGYALRVRKRIAQLRGELPALQQALDRAKASQGEAYVAMVRAAVAGKGSQHPFSALAAQAMAFDDAASAGQSALAQAEQSAASQRAGLAAKRTEIQTTIQAADAALDEANAAYHAAHEKRARAEGLLKRAQIEVRAANEAARQAVGEDAKFAPPEFADRIRKATEAEAGRQAELTPVLAACDQAQKLAWQREDELKAAHRALAQIDQQAKQIDQQTRAAIGAQAAQASAAERARHDAYVQAGHAMIEAKPRDLPATEKEAATLADQATEAAERRVRLHRMAMQAADKPAVTRGIMVMAAGGALLLLLLLGIGLAL